jgi:hypothetical protein
LKANHGEMRYLAYLGDNGFINTCQKLKISAAFLVEIIPKMCSITV